tara:strand:+ start:465 stop:989 length:525 start_codon:yes stop_codon:yes gene_type:complete
MKSIFGALALCVLFFGTSVKAKEPKHLGTFGDWSAYQTTENGEKACYMLSFPKKEEGNYTKRGRVYLLITHRPASKTFNVASFHAGYGFKNGQEVTVQILGRKKKDSFTLFTEGETAWAPDASTDKAIATGLSQWGNSLVVHGVSARGTKTKDTYSLRGSLKAFKAISKACGVR